MTNVSMLMWQTKMVNTLNIICTNHDHVDLVIVSMFSIKDLV